MMTFNDDDDDDDDDDFFFFFFFFFFKGTMGNFPMASLLQKVYIYALSHKHANTYIHTHHTHIRSFAHPRTHTMTSYSGI